MRRGAWCSSATSCMRRPRARCLPVVRDRREQHAALAIKLVRGRHDSRAGDPPPALRIEVVDEPWLPRPLRLLPSIRRIPRTSCSRATCTGAPAAWAGSATAMRLPCFVQGRAGATQGRGQGQAVLLPAFGEFTRGRLDHGVGAGAALLRGGRIGRAGAARGRLSKRLRAPRVRRGSSLRSGSSSRSGWLPPAPTSPRAPA